MKLASVNGVNVCKFAFVPDPDMDVLALALTFGLFII